MNLLGFTACVNIDPRFLSVVQSVSDLVNDAVRVALAEESVDLAAFDQRAQEPDRIFEDFD